MENRKGFLGRMAENLNDQTMGQEGSVFWLIRYIIGAIRDIVSSLNESFKEIMERRMESHREMDEEWRRETKRGD